MARCTSFSAPTHSTTLGSWHSTTFFEVAAQRRSAVRSPGVFPPELYHQIIDLLDHETWRACLTVSPAIRSYCLIRFRLDDCWGMFPGSVPVPEPSGYNVWFTLGLTNFHTGETALTKEIEIGWSGHNPMELRWIPIIGIEPKALMTNVVIGFVKEARSGGCREPTNETGNEDSEGGWEN